MTRLIRLLLITLSAVSAALAQAPATYSIAGMVVAKPTQAPLPSVLVSIRPALQQEGEPISVLTDAAGRFDFSDLAAGKYSLSAERRGEQPHFFHAHGVFSTAVATGPDLDSQHIVFPMAAEARISGSVLDEDGDPVQGATVYLLHDGVFNGKRSVTMVTQANTTSSGAYHFGHLSAGSYYLAVSARPWYASRPSSFTRLGADGQTLSERVQTPAWLDTAYPVTYSGDTTDAAAAQPIALSAGSSVRYPINLRAVPAIHVPLPSSGTDAQPIRMGGLSAKGPGGVAIQVSAEFMGSSDENGAGAEILGITPGTYLLGNVPPNADLQTIQPEHTLTVGESGSATFTPLPGITVRGRLHVDGAAPEAPFVMALLGKGQPIPALVQPDGTFSFQKLVVPGRYHLGVGNNLRLRVQSVMSGSHESQGNIVEIPPGTPSPLDLTISIGAAALSNVTGIARRNGKPVAGAMILLLPPKIEDGASIGRDQSDSDGTFTIPSIKAGQYTLVAIDNDNDDDKELEYREAAVLKPYLAQGKSITIPAATQPINIEVTSGR